MTTHVLTGLRPTPLATYLAGLGLIRVVGEQADPDLTAAWRDGCLVLETTADDLAQWLVDEYVPTPVLSPWNDGSGFGAKDVTPRQRLAELAAMPSVRLDPLRQALAVATEVGQRYRVRLAAGWKKDAAKQEAVQEFRNRCPEQLVPWIDATVVLAGETYFPPLLGTGGNDGRLDFSTTFHQCLIDVLGSSPKTRERSLALARDLLHGTQSEALQQDPVGQFDPAGAGGKNSSPFGDASSLLNPWAFVLLIEGALLFAASAARRHLHNAQRAAVPFTVASSPDGSATGAHDEPTRGEVWAPVWDRLFSLREVRHLFAEARAAWRGRPAQRAADFYAATRTLGVARGVAAFQRYGLHQRNGLAYVAVPIELVEVREVPAVRIARHLEDWASRVRRGDATTAVGRAVRRFDAAHLEFVRNGDPRSLVGLLAALTDLELAVGRSGRTRDTVPVRQPPDARDFIEVLRSEETAELRIAVGLASCATRPGRDGRPARMLRHLLLPIDPDGRWRSAPLVPGYGLRPLPRVLGEVMAWRGRTGVEEVEGTGSSPWRGVPGFRTGVAVPAADLHALADDRLDWQRLDLLLRACLALRWDRVRLAWDWQDPVAVVPTLALLHPLAAGLAPTEPGAGAPLLALSPDWPVRLMSGQVAEVHAEAARRLRQAGWDAVPPPPTPVVRGEALATALVPRCDGHPKMLSLAAVRIREEGDATAGDTAHDHTSEQIEELTWHTARS